MRARGGDWSGTGEVARGRAAYSGAEAGTGASERVSGAGERVTGPGEAPSASAGPLVLISANNAWNLVNYRLRLMQHLRAAGYRVVCLAAGDDSLAELKAEGFPFIPIPIRSRSTGMLGELRLLLTYLREFRIIRRSLSVKAVRGGAAAGAAAIAASGRDATRRRAPAVFLGITIKPNIWGSIAARMLGFPTINNIAGLGAFFSAGTAAALLGRMLYRMALRRSARIFFQNPEDLAHFVASRVASPSRCGLLPGSGVDLQAFAQQELPVLAYRAARLSAGAAAKTAAPIFPSFILVARLLRQKGVLDFVEAARLLKPRYGSARFIILGIPDERNPDAVPVRQLQNLDSAGLIEFHPGVRDVRPFVAQADVAVLPSYYREGTPRALIEAAAMGRAIIATNLPGCRELVIEGKNGFFCEPQNPQSLARAMQKLLDLSPSVLREFGQASRELAERKFDDSIVFAEYEESIKKVFAR